MSSVRTAQHNKANTGHGSISPQLQRSKSVNRKDTARKCLLGSINTRFNDVRHSSPGVVGEPMRHDIKFPKVNKISRGNGQKVLQNDRSNYSQSSSRALSRSDDSQDLPFKNVSKSSNHGLNLPEIIMEFNIEANMAASGDRYEHSRSTSEVFEDERAIGFPYEEFLRRSNYSNYNPCRAKYRPVTPGLLESLNKLKVPSKMRTEQWLKSTQYLQKSHCGHAFKTERLNNPLPNWIYTDS